MALRQLERDLALVADALIGAGPQNVDDLGHPAYPATKRQRTGIVEPVVAVLPALRQQSQHRPQDRLTVPRLVESGTHPGRTLRTDLGRPAADPLRCPLPHERMVGRHVTDLGHHLSPPI